MSLEGPPVQYASPPGSCVSLFCVQRLGFCLQVPYAYPRVTQYPLHVEIVSVLEDVELLELLEDCVPVLDELELGGVVVEAVEAAAMAPYAGVIHT